MIRSFLYDVIWITQELIFKFSKQELNLCAYLACISPLLLQIAYTNSPESWGRSLLLVYEALISSILIYGFTFKLV